ncbi:MAG TPA: peptidylprolyl isomerase [Nannocystaceae bacterium]|nr:peptidylprolyl isomerase [Nannocystaceae bacterium]
MLQDSVRDGKVVLFNYTLRNDEGEVLDASDPGEPMAYLHGADNIVPGLESEMSGKSIGARFDVVVPPELGYGRREEPGLRAIPRDAFGDDMELAEGMELILEDDEGDLMPIWIAEVHADAVIVDVNHPLADETLHFAVEIVGIRDATESELEHGHPHGPGGVDEDDEEEGED